MATESPMRMHGATEKWAGHMESNMFVPGQVPNRSGSAPPNMEGSFVAINNLLNDRFPSSNVDNGKIESHANPSFSASYFNPDSRLSPPFNSWETHCFGRFENRWGLNISDDNASAPLPTHKEVSEEESALESSFENTVAGQKQDLAVSVQEDNPPFSSELHSQSNSSGYETKDVVESDTDSISSRGPQRTTSNGVTSATSSLSFHDAMKLAYDMKSLNLSDSYQSSHENNILPLNQQPSLQINNGVQVQNVKSEMNYQDVNSAYLGTNQFPAAYMTPNAFYPDVFRAPGVYTPQYGYPLNPSIFPQFVAGYPSHGGIPMVIDGAAGQNYNGQVSTGGSIVQAADIQYFNKFYGQAGFTVQPSFAHVSYAQQYYPLPFDPSAYVIDVGGNQRNAVFSQNWFDVNDHNNAYHGLNNPNLGKTGMISPHYHGNQPNMGILLQYPSQARNEMSYSPGSGRYAGEYSGQQSHSGFDNFSDPKLCDILEELKSGRGRRFELSDVAGHIVELSVDQHGSRFIQQKLEVCNAEEKTSVFQEVLRYAPRLMTDVFGNYVIQKFFEYGTAQQRRELANELTGQILPLSMQMYGCRVIQKALDVIEVNQKAQLIRELDGHVVRCVRDQNGNHVIQKCIESVPTENIEFIISAFRGQVASLSMHPYGCRVIQRVLENCTDDYRWRFIVEEILESVCALAEDQYGNYVTQHVLVRGTHDEREKIVRKLSGHMVKLSQHKFASNVIEKCLDYCGPTERGLIFEEIVGKNDADNNNLLVMMKDQFGNYVIQKIFETCTENQRGVLINRTRTHAHALKKFTYGKHIVSRFEQLFEQEDQT